VFPAYWWGAAFLVNVFTVAIVFTAVTIWSPRSKDDESTPQFLQFVRGYSPLDAGVATLPLAAVPLAAVLVAGSPRSAGWAAKIGATKVITAGFGYVAVGFVVMSTVTTASSYLTIAIALVLLGIGMGITVAPATGSIMSAVPLNKAGVGSAVNDATREVAVDAETPEFETA